MLGNKRRKPNRHKDCQEKRKFKKLEPAREDDDSFCEIITPARERIGEEQQVTSSHLVCVERRILSYLSVNKTNNITNKRDRKKPKCYLFKEVTIYH